MTFEYLVESWYADDLCIEGILQDKLNELGAAGWELINVIPQISTNYSNEYDKPPKMMVATET